MKQLLLLLCAATGTCAWAQVNLTRVGNEWRQGDRLNKVQVEYVHPGDLGQECIWRMGEITKQSKAFRQSVASNGDTVAVFEPNRIVHFVVNGDTLWDKGEQQRRTYRIYQKERPVLRYPFSYGDSIGGSFLAKGKDESIDLTVSGFGYTVADGMGLLTDGTDTLRHILRLHLVDDYTEDYGGQVQLHYLRDRYQWYKAGYRYPVQESIHLALLDDEYKAQPVDSVTYLYLPDAQLELAEDMVNDSIRQLFSLLDAQSGTQGGIKALSDIKATLSPDGRTLTIDYTLMEGASDLSFIACDVMGNVLGSKRIDNVKAGDHQETLTLSRKPVGNALMLHIESGEEKQTEKVYQ